MTVRVCARARCTVSGTISGATVIVTNEHPYHGPTWLVLIRMHPWVVVAPESVSHPMQHWSNILVR